MAIYMQIEGLPGNVTESGHTKWIEVDSFRFGCGRGVSSRTPGNTVNREAFFGNFFLQNKNMTPVNREASTVSISEISVSKEMDETSPKLFTLACVGTGKTIKIEFCRTGATPLVYASIELSDALISSYGVDGGSGRSPHENLSINFSKIQYKYTPYNEKGEAGSPIAATYDLETAKSS